MNSIISYRNPAPPAGFTIIKNVQKRKKRVSVNRNTLLSSYNRCKIRIQITNVIWIQETIENSELSLDLFYHSSYNNEEYERDMEEEY